MKFNTTTILFVALFSSSLAFGETFEKEAAGLVKDLKSSLLVNLKGEMTKNGVEAAIPFCHINVSSIAKGAAKDQRMSKYEFGRTSHKIRNEKNAPTEWLLADLKKFEGTFYDKEKEKDYPIISKLPNGKKYYAEPLFVQAQCLACHGENVDSNVSKKINEFYPNDKAVGFKLNEFRGLIWVKER